MSARLNRAARRWLLLCSMGMQRAGQVCPDWKQQRLRFIISGNAIFRGGTPASVVERLDPLPSHNAFWVRP